MNRFRRAIFIALIVGVSASLLSSCAKRPEAVRTAGPGGVFRYFLGEPAAIDPLNAQESEGIEVTKQLFDGLVDYDPLTMETVPAVAASWRSDMSSKVFTFYLREGTRFHNGRLLTARDFKWSWERVVRKGSGSDVAYHFAPIAGFEALSEGKAKHLRGVRVVDDKTLEVTLSYPYAEFPTILGHPVFSPVPKEEVQRDPAAFAESPVGNGPFRMSGKWRHGRAITVRRFDQYYGDKANLKSVVFQIFDGDQAGFAAFTRGDLDFSSVPSGQIKAAKRDYGSRALIGKPQLAVTAFGIDLSKAPLGDRPKLRRAISFAIDREAIAGIVYEGANSPAGSFLPRVLSGGRGPYVKRDIGKAKRLLGEAGYGKGGKRLSMKIAFAIGRGNEDMAQLVQQDLADVGVRVELEGMEQGAFIGAMRKGQPQVFAFNWAADYPNADSILYPLLYSKSQDNLTGYRNTEVDRMLITARGATQEKRRRRLYTRIDDAALESVPMIPLTFVGSRAVIGKNVRGFVRTPLDDTPLDRVWFAP